MLGAHFFLLVNPADRTCLCSRHEPGPSDVLEAGEQRAEGANLQPTERSHRRYVYKKRIRQKPRLENAQIRVSVLAKN